MLKHTTQEMNMRANWFGEKTTMTSLKDHFSEFMTHPFATYFHGRVGCHLLTDRPTIGCDMRDAMRSNKVQDLHCS
jgi:hypothetical protein